MYTADLKRKFPLSCDSVRKNNNNKTQRSAFFKLETPRFNFLMPWSCFCVWLSRVTKNFSVDDDNFFRLCWCVIIVDFITKCHSAVFMLARDFLWLETQIKFFILEVENKNASDVDKFLKFRNIYFHSDYSYSFWRFFLQPFTKH